MCTAPPLALRSRTGLPLATHTLYHSSGAAQMALFDEEGVDPARSASGTATPSPHWTTASAVARWGGYVSIDNLGHQAGDHEDRVRELVLGLLEAGFAETQMLLSQDVGQVAELRARVAAAATPTFPRRSCRRLRRSGVGEDMIRDHDGATTRAAG